MRERETLRTLLTAANQARDALHRRASLLEIDVFKYRQGEVLATRMAIGARQAAAKHAARQAKVIALSSALQTAEGELRELATTLLELTHDLEALRLENESRTKSLRTAALRARATADSEIAAVTKDLRSTQQELKAERKQRAAEAQRADAADLSAHESYDAVSVLREELNHVAERSAAELAAQNVDRDGLVARIEELTATTLVADAERLDRQDRLARSDHLVASLRSKLVGLGETQTTRGDRLEASKNVAGASSMEQVEWCGAYAATIDAPAADIEPQPELMSYTPDLDTLKPAVPHRTRDNTSHGQTFRCSADPELDVTEAAKLATRRSCRYVPMQLVGTYEVAALVECLPPDWYLHRERSASRTALCVLYFAPEPVPPLLLRPWKRLVDLVAADNGGFLDWTASTEILSAFVPLAVPAGVTVHLAAWIRFRELLGVDEAVVLPRLMRLDVGARGELAGRVDILATAIPGLTWLPAELRGWRSTADRVVHSAPAPRAVATGAYFTVDQAVLAARRQETATAQGLLDEIIAAEIG